MASLNVFHLFLSSLILCLQIHYAHGTCANPKQAPALPDGAPEGFGQVYKDVWSNYCKGSGARTAIRDFLTSYGVGQLTKLSSFCNRGQIAVTYAHECQFIDVALVKTQSQLPMKKHAPANFRSLYDKVEAHGKNVHGQDEWMEEQIDELLDEMKPSDVITLQYYCIEQGTKSAATVCKVIAGAFRQIAEPISHETTPEQLAEHFGCDQVHKSRLLSSICKRLVGLFRRTPAAPPVQKETAADLMAKYLGCDGVFKSKLMCDEQNFKGIRAGFTSFCQVIDSAFGLEFAQVCD